MEMKQSRIADLAQRDSVCRHWKPLLFGVMLATLLTSATARAQQCGPSNVTVPVGGHVNYTILSPVPSNAIISSNPNPANATVSPANINNQVNPTFVITGVAPGTTSMTITWAPVGSNMPTTCNVLINVTCSTITLSPMALPGGIVGTAYKQTVTANGGTPSYTFAVTSGALPPGVMLSLDGSISGTPTTAGTFNFTVRVVDSKNCPQTQNYTVVIRPTVNAGPDLYYSDSFFVRQHYLDYLNRIDANGPPTANDPVITSTGEFIHNTLDMQLGGPLPLSFGRYHGGLVGASAGSRSFYGATDSPMGANWVHNSLILLRRIDANNVAVHYYQGKSIYLQKSGGTWSLNQPGNSYRGTLYQLVEAGTKLKMMDPVSQVVYTFDTSGLADGGVRGVETVSDRNGNTHSLAYNTDSTLARVADGLGRSLDFTYVNAGGKPRVFKVTDQSGRFVQFDYSGAQLAAYTDARTKATTYSTNSSSLVESITHPGGNSPVRNTYISGSAKVASQADGLGNTTRLAYNADNTLITDALGNNRTHFFNPELRFVGYKDEAEKTIQFGYDNSQRNTSTTDRMGDTNTISYDAVSGKVNARTDNTGKTWKYSYSAQTQDGFTYYDMTRIDYPDGTRDDFSYDTKGNLLGRTDRAGKTGAYTYNSRGQLLTATNPDGGVVTYTYNADGTPASAKDPAGNTTTFDYDALKRLNKITRPDTTTVQYTYDANDNVVSGVNEKGKATTYSYDDNNNLKTITNPLGKTRTFAYDANEKLTAITDPLGKATTFAYDALQRVKSVTDRNGNATTYNYSATGRISSVVDAAGKTSSFTHDAEGVLTSFTNPLGRVWQSTSDKQGQTKSVADPLSNQTRFDYDALSRLISQTNPLSETMSYAYDPRGLIRQASQPGPITVAYTRNNLGLITQIIDPRGKTRSRSYDNLGRMLSSTDPLGNVTQLTYDQRNRPSRIDLPLSTLNLTYNGLGLITSLKYSDGTRVDYSYDDNNRLTSANGIAFGYDDNGRIISGNGITLTRDSGGRIATMTLAPGKTVSYVYDNRNLVTSVSDWVGGITRFSYDDAGRLVSVTWPNGVTTTYSYDNADRLTAVVEARGQTTLSSISLIKDAKGQTKQATRDVPLSPAVGKQNPSQSYNDADQIVGYTYDAMGRLTGVGAVTYSWDLASRLTSYSDGQNTIGFTYDAFDNRLTRTEGGNTRSFVWNYALGLPSISVVKDDANIVRYYVHTPGGALLYSVEDSGNARLFHHHDEVGSTLFLTNDSGNITDRYAYSPYGQLTASSGSSDNPFTYVGKFGVMREASADLYYMRARYYDSASGRFLSRDPFRLTVSDPKSLNSYQYAAQNPSSCTDPLGLAQSSIDFYLRQDSCRGESEDHGRPSRGTLIVESFKFRVLINDAQPTTGSLFSNGEPLSSIAPAGSTSAIANRYYDFPIDIEPGFGGGCFLQPKPDVLMPVSGAIAGFIIPYDSPRATLIAPAGSTYAIANPYGDDFPIAFDPGFGGSCFLQPKPDVLMPVSGAIAIAGFIYDSPRATLRSWDGVPISVREAGIKAGLVSGFITLLEYRRRFGP